MNEQEIQQKTAAFMDAAKQIGSSAGQALGTAAATGAVAMLPIAVAKLYDAATKARDYRAMLAANPEVHEFAMENPRQAAMMFTSLRSVNPEFSKDPFVAGHVMRQMTNDPQGAGGYLMVASGERGKFEHPVLDTYLKGAIEGGKPRPMGGGLPKPGGRGGPPGP